MRYFLDTEFVEDGETIMPISLALIREDGNSLYLEFDFDKDKANAHDFVRENVLPHLREPVRYTQLAARKEVIRFIEDDDDGELEFWAYYADYDWILFCQLFGTMMDLPSHYPKLCFDLQQLWLLHAKPRGAIKPPQPENAHDALADAMWNMEFYNAMVGEPA